MMNDLDDSVNFGCLQKELSAAVQRDEKYQRENDAKFRAIHQKVANYDEFRDIVEASHLKPLQREDKLGGIAYQKWNAGNTSDKTSYNTSSTTTTTSYPPPQNQQDFNKVWKRNCKTLDDKLHLLLTIDVEDFSKCTSLDCPVGEMLTVLNTCQEEKHFPTILYLLDTIRSSKRFSLQMSFLAHNEKQQITSLFQRLSQWNIKIDIQEICKMINSLELSFLVE